MCDKKLPKMRAIIFMWDGCPYSEQSFTKLINTYGKENVKKIIVDNPTDAREHLVSHFTNASGSTVPFMILDNTTFVGSNTELQNMNLAP